MDTQCEAKLPRLMFLTMCDAVQYRGWWRKSRNIRALCYMHVYFTFSASPCRRLLNFTVMHFESSLAMPLFDCSRLGKRIALSLTYIVIDA